MKTFLRFLLRRLYRFHAFNEQVLKTPGPVLLLPNHVSWLDWLFLLVCTDQDWKCVVSERTARTSWLHRKIMINRRTFPIDTDSPYAVKHMAEFLAKGGRLALFPEGRLSRTGTLMKLFDGTGFLLHKTGAKVITCYLRGAHRLPVSPNHNRKKWFPTITAHFSDVLTPPHVEHLSTSQARALFTSWLRDKMVAQQFETEMKFGPQTVADAIVETATRFPKHVVLQDVNAALSYRKLLVGADLMAAQLRAVLSRDLQKVGVLLPNVNATPVVLLSLWSLGREPAIFNFSTGPAIMLACAQLAGVRQIITSRAFLERAKLDVSALSGAAIEFIYLEDIRARISGGAKLRSLVKQTFAPGLECADLSALSPADDLSSAAAGQVPPQESGDKSPHSKAAVILFTSGSEGVPKGVELTHRNILANARQMLAVTDLTDNDRIFNAMPLFHSFGLTVGTLLPLVRGMFVFIYPSPLHYRVVPTAFYTMDCTIMLGTNTFLNGYARKANPYDFRSLRYMFAAAEKLQEATATTWAQRFGVRVLEGYGATECAPCVSVNTPLQAKYGSAGRLMPGMEYRLEHVEGISLEGRAPQVPDQKNESPLAPNGGAAFQPPSPSAAGKPPLRVHGEGERDGTPDQSGTRGARPSNEEVGRLFVRGPNVMKGYLNADANAKFLALGGWYDTGDIVRVDAEGYVFIQGRLKRFAKISGEMVSLTAVEDALAGAFPHYGLRCQIAVIARLDEDKGEKLIAVSNEAKLSLEEIRGAIKAKGLPNIAVPREVKFIHEIPKLGTGKTNHRELEKILAVAEPAKG